MTEWRDVVGAEGFYEVSDDGQVRSTPRRGRAGRVLKQNLVKMTNDERYYVSMSLGSKESVVNKAVAPIVATAFHGPKPDGMECCHIDGNGLNNHASNLMWGTHTENMAHTKLHGTNRPGSKSHLSKLTEQQVIEIRARRINGENTKDLALEFKVTRNNIQAIIARRSWNHI